MTIKPYTSEDRGKKEQVREMFNNISGRYDFLNHFFSLGIDRLWRRTAVRKLVADRPKKILDIATGTGDFAIECLRLNPEKIVGIDISREMLEVGRKKIAKKGLDKIIELEIGDAENLKFEDESFDAAVVAFGVRNFESLEKGLTEINRVLKKDARLVILEFSQPHSFPVKQLYGFYFSKILPALGALISGDKRAYTYLNESVNAFPEGRNFLEILNKCSFGDVSQSRLMSGIASIYVGKK